MPEPLIHKFDNYEIDSATRELRYLGVAVELEPRAFALLELLVRNRDRAMSKEEIQEQLWSGTIVTESALTRCISKIRRAVSPEGRQEFVRTVHGFGYQFVGKIDDQATEAPIESPNTPPLLPDLPSIAVLAFDDLSTDSKNTYFADGIADDIITALSRFRSLVIISRYSSFSYKGKSISPQTIGHSLGVAYLLQGSVQHESNRIRLNVQLVDSSSGNHIWAERYDRQMGDIFALQDELTSTIVATVGGRVNAEGRMARKRSETAPRAYDLVLKGQWLHFKVQKIPNAEAAKVLNQALQLDPDNARAHALLGAVHLIDFTMNWTATPEASLQLAIQHGWRSVQIDDTDSQAQAHLGETLLNAGQYTDARIRFEQAIKLNPSDIISRALYSLYFCEIGEASKGLEQLALVSQLDPFELSWIPWFRGITCYLLGAYEEAIDSLARVVEPINDVRRWQAASYAQLGDSVRAQSLMREFLDNAEGEMPLFPGWAFSDWKPILENQYTYLPYAERLCHGLRKAWPTSAKEGK
jgi:TolB-like protein